jgi:hypothetical protein
MKNLILALVNFIILITASYGDIRCHCNQPQCVRTGYMCKSTGASAACFLEHSGYVNVDGRSDISRHGCIELLPQQMRDMCAKNLHQPLQHHSHHNHRHHNQNQSIICCSEDMCNYVKNVDLINARTQPKANESVGALTPSSGSNLPNSVWFQVTVITVPIAGSIVLVILIFMATKVLRQDTKRQRQISEIRKQRQFKTHLLLNSGALDAKHQQNRQQSQQQNQGSGGGKGLKPDKNETNAKINDLEKGCDITNTRQTQNNNGNNLYNIINMSYKDSNLANTEQQANTDKDSLFAKPLNSSLYSSLLTYGK